jgi:hypothetical protein
MRGVPILAAVLAALAMPAAALSPALECYPSSGPEANLGGYSPAFLGNGFVYYSTFDPSDIWIDILEYCPERRQLVLRTGRDASEDARDQAAVAYLQEMIFGPEPYTQRQMAERLRAFGAEVEIRTVNYESCGCTLQ